MLQLLRHRLHNGRRPRRVRLSERQRVSRDQLRGVTIEHEELHPLVENGHTSVRVARHKGEVERCVHRGVGRPGDVEVVHHGAG
jgi:hypothetical protein